VLFILVLSFADAFHGLKITWILIKCLILRAVLDGKLDLIKW